MQHHLHTPGSPTRLAANAKSAVDVAGAAGRHDPGEPPAGRPGTVPEPPVSDQDTWSALFGAPPLTAADQQSLATVAQVRSVAIDTDVFGHDQAARSLIAVRSGDVALGYRTADCVFRVERPVRGPAWLDQSSAWLEDRHSMDARATSDAVLLDLPLAALRQLVGARPHLAQRLVASLALEVRALTINTHELMHKDAPGRFAAWLLQRCEPVGEADERAVIRLGERKRDIASQLAITPETLSRLMRSLSRRGVISVAGYTVQVLDLPGLRRIAVGV